MLLSLAVLSFMEPANSQEISLEELPPWRETAEDKQFAKTNRKQDAHLLQFVLKGGTRVAVVVARLASVKVEPVLAGSRTEPTSLLAAKHQALAAINGGYFNLSNGESASFVSCRNKLVADPRLNKALVENPHLKAFLPQIFARSELRLGRDSEGKIVAEIAGHNEKLKAGTTLLASLQAGPRLLPEINARQEAFLRQEAENKEIDSIGVNRTAARAAVGLTADGYIMLVAVAGKGQDEFSSGLSLSELATVLKRLGASSALNLDGGTSTTLVGCISGNNYKMLIGRNPETRVRSALTIMPVNSN